MYFYVHETLKITMMMNFLKDNDWYSKRDVLHEMHKMFLIWFIQICLTSGYLLSLNTKWSNVCRNKNNTFSFNALLTENLTNTFEKSDREKPKKMIHDWKHICIYYRYMYVPKTDLLTVSQALVKQTAYNIAR